MTNIGNQSPTTVRARYRDQTKRTHGAMAASSATTPSTPSHRLPWSRLPSRPRVKSVTPAMPGIATNRTSFGEGRG
jgi:hypothetical protein